MIPLEDARTRVLEACARVGSVELPLARALGHVTTATVSSGEAIPPFDNTAMDGFAVRASDTADAPVRLEVVASLAAGTATDRVLGPGEAMRIMTGAPMPPGADAVVMVERTRAVRGGVDGGDEGDGGEVVEVEVAVESGNHVRRAGDDVRPGDEVLAAGTTLTAGHLGVLASLGLETVEVVRRPVVGVFSTGDELVEGGGPLEPGQIRDSNRLTLLALVEESGFEGVDLGLVRDDEDAIADAVRDGVSRCDAVLTSGGVSMGDYDYVKVVLDRLGDMDWMQVAIKPAKPFAFGVVDGVPVFGLPGNPVSSMVSFELFARPALRRMAGHSDLDRPRVRGVADEDLRRRADGKIHFLRVATRYEHGAYRARPAGGQGSHQLTAMAAADALAVLPDGDGTAAGDEVDLLLLR
ncbi:MAG: gephyrin-like molybdotransferase Glp [Acidimicrobiia bacterium]|nr:gephyrin-like molybdotransferase Glp [Acidimicrobiia bacterium]